MARITLVTGGGRSGKSGWAQRRAEELPGNRLFIATCPPLDDEMRERIRKHREARAGRGWESVEAPLELAQAIRAASADVLLVDCLTLWINNLMYEADRAGKIFGEREAEMAAQELMTAARAARGTVVLVTNEVGWGIIPENALARRYRDLAGRCNQVVAAAADDVALLVCGIPLMLKGHA